MTNPPSSSIEYEDLSTPRSSCPNKLCAQFRTQHRLMTEKHNRLEKELEHARRQHTMLYNQVVTRGEQSMVREAATGETSVRLPNGEEMTPEKFMAKTRMMNQCRESLQASEKRARQLGEENERLKLERNSLYAKMRAFEEQLNGFERARHYDVFTDEMHREAVAENGKLVERVERLTRRKRELKEENAILKRRLAQEQQQKESAMAARVPKKKRRMSSGSEDEGEADT